MRIEERVKSFTPKQLEEAKRRYLSDRSRPKWIPNIGPQSDAYFSKADVLLYGGEPGGGKLLNIKEQLPTPSGWTTMGDVQVGDEVIDESGRPCRVTFKSAVQFEKSYRLVFSDGSTIEAGANHQWMTRDRRERLRAWGSTDARRTIRRANRPSRAAGNKSKKFTAIISRRNAERAATKGLPIASVRTTQEIADSLLVGVERRINHSIDVCGSLQLPTRELLVEPYVLGVWLGDGSTGAGTLTGLDEEIFLQVGNSYTVTRHADPKSRGVLGFQRDLEMLGVLHDKHIPRAYLRASHEQRLALLQGLMDTDGHCDVCGQCEFSQVKRGLAEQFMELIASLGIKATMREGVAKLNGRITGPNYKIKFLTSLPAFRLSRKLIRQKRGGFRGMHDVRYIVDAVPIDPVPMQCIQVDGPNRMYLCGRSMIPTHNTDLLLGLAFNSHQRSLIMRRQYTDLGAITDRAIELNGSRKGYNGAAPPSLRPNDRQLIEFGAAAKIGDEQHFQGNPHDLIGLDEGTQFAESQIRFLMGWLRSTDEKQRKRVVIASNPALTAEGLWVNEMFAPWLDKRFQDPAKPGELRWVVSDEDGKDRWVDGPEPVEINGRLVKPLSRTYIPASVTDNPHLMNTGYQAQLDALPEPFRSILLGGFRVDFKDSPNQVIPTNWIRAAILRWSPSPPKGIPMCAMGVDCSGGGADPMVISWRHDGWYAPLLEIPGKEIPMDKAGRFAAGVIVAHRKDGAEVIVDMGGGYGGTVYETLKENEIPVIPYKGSEGSNKKTKDKQLKFFNKRSEAIWRFREALDPDQSGGSPIMLPDDPVLVADLAAPTLDMAYNGIKVEAKEKIVERLGRSTNRGDAAIMAWTEGPKAITNADEWRIQKKAIPRNRNPRVITKRDRAN